MSKKAKQPPKYPYGVCECNTCIIGLGGCGGLGPAAFEVTRKGKRIRLCTRCDFSDDKDKTLLVTEKDGAKLWLDFDPLGAFCIMGKLLEKRDAS